MKKVLIALLVISTMAFAEGLMFRKGTNAINAGVSLNNLLNEGDVRPGILFVYDRGLSNMFSIGAEFNYFNYTSVVALIETRSNYLTPAGRFGFHPLGIPGLDGTKAAGIIDPYVVFAAGVNIDSWTSSLGSTEIDNDSDVNFVWGFKPGIRFFFNEKVNIWAELNNQFLVNGGNHRSGYLAIGAGIAF